MKTTYHEAKISFKAILNPAKGCSGDARLLMPEGTAMAIDPSVLPLILSSSRSLLGQ
jgi:hypothetical protein